MKKLFKKITKRDINSPLGLFFKNSTYQFSNILVSKIGSFAFTLILARILMPSLFGLYSLALSVVFIFSSLSDLGINKVAVIILSKQKTPYKFKRYMDYIFKLKIYLLLFFIIVLAAASFPISLAYGKPPLFFGLIGGMTYILFSGLSTLFESFFQAKQNFKIPFIKETIFQILRILITIPAIFILINLNKTEGITIFSSLFFISLSYFFAAAFLFLKLKIIMRPPILKKPHSKKLSKKEKRNVMHLLYPLSFNALSDIFFTYFDLIILGFFVIPSYLGYYQVALTFLSLATPFSSLALVLLPIFSSTKGKRLKRIFDISSKYLLLITIVLGVAVFFLSSFIVQFLYGTDYISSINILKILTPLFVLVPLTTLHYNYLISIGRQITVSALLVSTSALNILLNLFLILVFFKDSPSSIVFVVAGVSVFSKLIYLTGLKLISR